MNTQLLALILIPLLFGFILFGRGASGSGLGAGIHTSNKVFAPAIFNTGISGNAFFRFQSFSPVRYYSPPPARPAYGAGAFSWNFFDP